MINRAIISAAFVIALGSGQALAATVNLTGTGGILTKTETFGDITVTAINTQESGPGDAPRILQSPFGLGVRGVSEGQFERDELDNRGDDEALIFDAGRVVNWDSLTLTLGDLFDDYRIYGTNDETKLSITTGGLTTLTAGATLLSQGGGSLFVTPFTVNIDAAFRFLIATTPGGSGDGYKVSEIAYSEVPVPGALPLLISGIAGLGFARRRKSA